jgi:hypothetical protein
MQSVGRIAIDCKVTTSLGSLMRHSVSRFAFVACLTLIARPTLSTAQSTPSDSVKHALQTLFDAMRSADTVRAVRQWTRS